MGALGAGHAQARTMTGGFVCCKLGSGNTTATMCGDALSEHTGNPALIAARPAASAIDTSEAPPVFKERILEMLARYKLLLLRRIAPPVNHLPGAGA